jgi:toxin ParE1/3/4
MKRLVYSKLAKIDMFKIGDYTREVWGEIQADRYLDQLEDCCERLMINPKMGRASDIVQPGLRRFEQGRHVIFYQQLEERVLIYRILHQSMLPARHIFDTSEEEAFEPNR